MARFRGFLAWRSLSGISRADAIELASAMVDRAARGAG
jgi:hypothetical protein